MSSKALRLCQNALTATTIISRRTATSVSYSQWLSAPFRNIFENIKTSVNRFSKLPPNKQYVVGGSIAGGTLISAYIIYYMDPFNKWSEPPKVMSNTTLQVQSKWFRKEVARLETAIKGCLNYGYIEDLKFIDESEDVLRRVLNLEDPEAIWRLGRILVDKAQLSFKDVEKKKYLKEAEEHLKKALEMQELAVNLQKLDHVSVNVYKWLAIDLLMQYPYNKKVNLDLVESCLNKALELDAKDPYLCYNKGLLKAIQKKHNEAIESFSNAEQIEPMFSTANLYHKGLSHLALGNKDEATSLFKTAAMITPRHNEDVKALIGLRNYLNKWKVKFNTFYAPYGN